MKKILLALLFLTILGGILRFYKINENPVGLNVDEVSIGYNAYSILKTGKDEYGFFLPLTFKSLGDYKPPLYIYLTTIPIALFGLNEFSVRFISAFLGTLSIPLSYFLFLTIIKNKKYALFGAAFFSISPWHVYFSRLGSESLTALFFVMLGTICMLKMINGKWIWAVLASIFLVSSMFTYHAERIFIPLFVTVFLTINFKRYVQNKRNLFAFLILSTILLLPLIYSVIFGPDRTRAQMTVISNDVEFIRNVLLDSTKKNIIDPFLLLFYGIRKYLAYFQPSFLFYNSLGMTKMGTYGLGVMYLFELPFIVMGIIALIRNKIANRNLILIWILIGIIPASLTLNEQHPIRTMVILPMFILISAIGAVEIIKRVKQLSLQIRIGIYFIFTTVIIWNLLQALIIYSIHFPKEKGEGLMEGTKQSVLYALANQDKYQEIIFDPVRGVEGPYLVNAPHAYILFYSKYDPAKYQALPKNTGKDIYGFDKFTIRRINWIEDKNKKNTLFIGSPWSLPEEQISKDDILSKVYLSNGKLALLIVSSKR